MNDRRSSGMLDRSNSGDVIEADSLVTEEPLLLRTDPDPISKPVLGDLPNSGRDEDRLLIVPPPISRPSTTCDPCGYSAWYSVTMSDGHTTMKGCTSAVSRGEVTALDGRSTGVKSVGRGLRNLCSKLSMWLRITGSTGEFVFLPIPLAKIALKNDARQPTSRQKLR